MNTVEPCCAPMATNLKGWLVSLCIISFPSLLRSQSGGDYQSKQSGDWSTASTWEVYSGSSWVNLGVMSTTTYALESNPGWTNVVISSPSTNWSWANNIGNSGTGGLTFGKTLTNTPSTWYYTSLTLFEGIEYSLVFDYKTSNATASNSRIVMAIGNAAPTASTTWTGATELYNALQATTNAWVSNTGTATFIPTVSGTYYFGFRASYSSVSATINTWVDNMVLTGTANIPSSVSKSVSVKHTVTVSGNLTTDQTTVELGGRLLLSGGTLTIADGTGNDLSIYGTYERTSVSTTMSINSGAVVSCESGGVYEHNVAGGSIPSITWQDGSNFKALNSAQSNLNQSFWDFTIAGGSASTLSVDNTSRTTTVRNNLYIQGGNLYLKNGGAVGGNHIIRVKGNYLQTGGSLAWNSNNTDNTSVLKLEVEKDLTISGGTWSGWVSATDCNSGVYFLGTVEQSYSTILIHDNTGAVRDRFYYKTSGGPTNINETYYGTSAQFTVNGSCGGSPPTGFSRWPTSGSMLKSFTINNSSGLTLRDNRTINNALYRTIGSISLGSGVAISYASSTTLSYNGTSAIVSENAEFPSSNGPTNLTIDNSGGVTLHADRTVSGQLNFLNGILTTGACNPSVSNTKIILSDNATSTGAGAGKYVDGIIRKVGNDVFTFPVGNGGQYAPAGISAPSLVTDHFTACYLKSNPQTTYPVDVNDQAYQLSPMIYLSDKEYWEIARTGGSSNVYVTLSWNNYSSGYITNANTLRVGHWKSQNLIAPYLSPYWENLGMSSVSGTTNSGSITSAAPVSNFSPFALGSEGESNPLPIDLVTFSAKKLNEVVEVSWVTASEINNDYFLVERSSDCQAWEPVGQTRGAGFSNKYLYYSLNDSLPIRGTSYYRLKQTDFDGNYVYSEIRPVNIKETERPFTLFPNPTEGRLIIEGEPTALGNIKISSIIGMPIENNISMKSLNSNLMEIDFLNMPSGIYFVSISGMSYRIIKN